MQVRVRVADGSIEESRSLRTWLRDEPAIRRHGEPATGGAGPPDEMGTGLDVLTLVIGTGLSAAQLVLAIITWRASHGRPVRVVIERDDRRIPVDTDDPGEAEAIAAAITAGEPTPAKTTRPETTTAETTTAETIPAETTTAETTPAETTTAETTPAGTTTATITAAKTAAVERETG